MFFPQNTVVPQGFDAAEIDPGNYAVCYLHSKENDLDFYSMETHNLCLDTLKAQGYQRKEDGWCFERYSCPRFTEPDEQGCVILDYGISILRQPIITGKISPIKEETI